MTEEQLEKRQGRAQRETLIIKKTDEGFRVYPPGNPARNWLVSGTPEEPECTCPDFTNHDDDPAWRCKHILAVAQHLNGSNGDRDPVDEEERRAIRDEGRERAAGSHPTSDGAPSQMVLKRSISPDGRIDSLSVELTCPVGEVPSGKVAQHARRALDLQSKIVEEFLHRDGGAGNGERRQNGNGARRRSDHGQDEAVRATLMRIGGLDTRYGRRLFISVQVNGETLKLFGSRKQLAEAIEAAGFRAERVEEGARLDLPCRVTTKPSDDGRYTNVDEVLPAADNGRERKAGR